MLYRDNFSSLSLLLAACLASHEPVSSLACHPFAVPSPATATGDALGDGQDIGMLVMQPSRVSATIHDMHMEVNRLWSSLEATEVAVAKAN